MRAFAERHLGQQGDAAKVRQGWRAVCFAAVAVAALTLAPTDADAGRLHFGFGLGFGGPYYYPYPYYPRRYYRPYRHRYWYRRHYWPYYYSRYGWPYRYGYPPYYDRWYEERRRRREAERYREQLEDDAAARYAAYQWFFSPHPYWLGGRLYWHVPPGVPDDVAALPEPVPQGPIDTDADPGSTYYPSYHPLYREEHR